MSDDAYQELVYAVSHDLAAPARHVRGFAQLLEERLGPGGEAGEADARTLELFGYLHQGADRLVAMIDGLLAVSRAGEQVAEIGRVELDEVVEATARLACARRKLSGAVEVAPGLPPVTADARLLRDALERVLDNALAYAGGARVAADSTSERVRLRIEDDGPGLHPRLHERIFRPLDRGDPPKDVPGAGVGLTVARRLLALMDGEISVESEEGGGARFVVELPAAG